MVIVLEDIQHVLCRITKYILTVLVNQIHFHYTTPYMSNAL